MTSQKFGSRMKDQVRAQLEERTVVSERDRHRGCEGVISNTIMLSIHQNLLEEAA